METSKSVIVTKFGNLDALNVGEFELPPLKGRVEVKVKYGGVNFADLYMRQGLMYKELPFVLGMECVGTVTAIGVEGTDLQVGQRVICYDYHCGMHREVVRTTPDNIYPLPDYISFEQGAGVFVNYLTAYFAVVELGHLKNNETVLIISCGGGVGCAATQLAKNIEGVTVVGTTSPEKYTEVQKNGVDKTLTIDANFEKNLVETCPEGFDLIVSTYAGNLFAFLETQLKPLGRIVIIGANNMIQGESRLTFFTFLKNWWTTKHVRLGDLIVYNRASAGLHLGTLIDRDPQRVRNALKKIFEMLKEEKLKVKIYEVLPMDRVVDATKLLSERKNVGKVLISMGEK